MLFKEADSGGGGCGKNYNSKTFCFLNNIISTLCVKKKTLLCGFQWGTSQTIKMHPILLYIWSHTNFDLYYGFIQKLRKNTT